MTPKDLNLAYGAVLSVLNNYDLEPWHKTYRQLAKRMAEEMAVAEHDVASVNSLRGK